MVIGLDSLAVLWRLSGPRSIQVEGKHDPPTNHCGPPYSPEQAPCLETKTLRPSPAAARLSISLVPRLDPPAARASQTEVRVQQKEESAPRPPRSTVPPQSSSSLRSS
jgi:hypothetical protein